MTLWGTKADQFFLSVFKLIFVPSSSVNLKCRKPKRFVNVWLWEHTQRDKLAMLLLGGGGSVEVWDEIKHEYSIFGEFPWQSAFVYKSYRFSQTVYIHKRHYSELLLSLSKKKQPTSTWQAIKVAVKTGNKNNSSCSKILRNWEYFSESLVTCGRGLTRSDREISQHQLIF